MLIRCEYCYKMFNAEFEICPYCGYFNGAEIDGINQLPVGTVLNGRYIIGQVLGFGGFGITYKVWDKKFSTVLAIKEYFPGSYVNRNQITNEVVVYSNKRKDEFEFGLSRFLDEAKNMAKFSSHDNIVNVYDFFTGNKTAYIVMEFLDGMSLNVYLKAHNVRVNEGVDIVLKVCSALNDIHSVGIIHRDISPDNIFICNDGRVKLIDFGAARFSSAEEMQRTIILKPGFAPPEQYESVSVQGPWTDIYALGATLYYLITKTKPEESTNRRILDSLKSPKELNPAIPENISNSVVKAMALDRHLRFSSIAEFEQALTNKTKVVPLKYEVKKRKARRGLGVAAAVLAVSVAAGFFVAAYKNEKNNNMLQKASIELWYMTKDDSDAENKAAAWGEIIDDFCTFFDMVTITAVGVPEEEYQAELDEAIDAENCPDVFESTDVSFSYGDAVDLTDTFNNACDSYDCYITKKFFNTNNEYSLPMGFEIPMVFENTGVSEFDGDFLNPSDMDIISQYGISADEQAVELFNADFNDDFDEYVTSSSANDFYNSKSGFLFSYSSSFFDVNAKLVGKYRIIPLELSEVSCKYCSYFSVGNSSEAEEKAALKLLEYMYCAKYQDLLHVEGKTNAFPLNKSALQEYVDVYPEFDDVNDVINKIDF